MKPFGLASSQQTGLITTAPRTNVNCDLNRSWLLRYRRDSTTVAYLNYTSPWLYSTVCKQASSFLVHLFGVCCLIYAGQLDCSAYYTGRYSIDIQSDARAQKQLLHVTITNWYRIMDINDEILRICENPLHDATTVNNVDVWMRREKIGSNVLADYRSRRKLATTKVVVDDKLKPYETTTGKDADDKKKLDRPIEYYNDEYCKISAKPSSDDSEEESTQNVGASRPPRELKTNTAFGRSKMPFVKFTRQHIGGDDCALIAQARCQSSVRDDGARARRLEGNYAAENTPLTGSDYGGELASSMATTDDVTLKCCGANVDTMVDVCTCMFLVKGVHYHCTKDSCPETDLDNEPCSCRPANGACVKRWTALGFCALLFPCLWCYPIARSCTEVCKCYKKQQASMKGRRNRTIQMREGREGLR